VKIVIINMTKSDKQLSRQNRKNAIPMNKLIHETLSRHGITKQVQSANIVKHGNCLLYKILDDEYKNDIRILSYSNSILTIVCRHGSSAHLANSIRAQIQKGIEESVPSASIADIHIKIDQKLLDNSADSLIY
jgi:hypothetical protein